MVFSNFVDNQFHDVQKYGKHSANKEAAHTKTDFVSSHLLH